MTARSPFETTECVLALSATPSDTDVIVTFAENVEEAPDTTGLSISGGISITGIEPGPGANQVTIHCDASADGETLSIAAINTIAFFGKLACKQDLEITA